MPWPSPTRDPPDPCVTSAVEAKFTLLNINKLIMMLRLFSQNVVAHIITQSKVVIEAIMWLNITLSWLVQNSSIVSTKLLALQEGQKSVF